MSDEFEIKPGVTRSKDCYVGPIYQVYKGSQSGHCCFEATVVDTTKPQILGGKHYQDSSGQYQYDAICECFGVDDAQRICDAMNKAAAPGSRMENER